MPANLYGRGAGARRYIPLNAPDHRSDENHSRGFQWGAIVLSVCVDAGPHRHLRRMKTVCVRRWGESREPAWQPSGLECSCCADRSVLGHREKGWRFLGIGTHSCVGMRRANRPHKGCQGCEPGHGSDECALGDHSMDRESVLVARRRIIPLDALFNQVLPGLEALLQEVQKADAGAVWTWSK